MKNLCHFKIWMPAAVIAFAAVASFLNMTFLRAKQSRPEHNLAAEAQADLVARKFRPLSAPLETLIADKSYHAIPTQTHPKLGLTAPDFKLNDTDGKLLKLSDKWNAGPVVLVFYYGYHCNHCVSQLFGLNKDIEKFHELGATVVAVSADSPELTLKRYQKYGPFAFPVLSDPDNKVAEQYAVFKPATKAGEEGDLMHGTFIIERGGKLVWANRSAEPFTENQTLLIGIHRREQIDRPKH